MATGKKPDQPDRAAKTQGADAGPFSGDLDDRRRRLAAELARKDATKKPGSSGERSETSAGVAQAMKLSSEFIAGILVGAALGWLIDHFAGTSPWGLVIFLLLGFVAGVLNILRSAGGVAQTGGIQPGRSLDEKNEKNKD
ncbi:ATP synthase subunit [Phyllobacterium salinisoli]|uniref:ATP synthase protein I n=1 Tax=Phyllobacterium salinisoli TaxID=1899321 RepID=A0A368K4L2_9HYPH|nr:AtpZ/AtpI family protein [Phyllobacterium salinisoli]RCS23423.1 ATP synthase subunit [Phyllobacterium salinisoli]